MVKTLTMCVRRFVSVCGVFREALYVARPSSSPRKSRRVSQWAIFQRRVFVLLAGIVFSTVTAGRSFAGESSLITSGGETLYYVGTVPPAISVNPSSLNFGTVTVGSLTTLAITVQNTGAGNLVIETVTSPSFPYGLSTDCSGQSVSQNSSCSISVTFAPTATGTFSSSLTIPSNDPNSPQFNVSVTGIANGAFITVIPNPVDFGSVGVGNSMARSVAIQNTGSANLVLGAIGALGLPFARAGGTCVNNETLVPTQMCTITLQFTPTSPGSFNGSFSVSSNATNASSVAVSLTGASSAFPLLTVVPNPLDFGIRTVGIVATGTVLIGNGGSGDLTLGSPAVSAATNPFSIASSTCIPDLTMTPGATCSVTVAFTPPSTGNFNGSFTVSSNTGNAPGTLTPVTLWGSASSALPTCSASFNPANISVNQSSTLSWTSANDADGKLAYTCTGNLGSGMFNFPTGSASVTPNATQTCTLSVDNSTGNTATCSATVSVGAQPSTCSASFAPATVTVGQGSTLTWTSTNDADAQLPYTCTGNLASGVLNGPAGSATVTPSGTQTCTLTVDNGSGSVNTCAATITVDGAASCSISFNPAGIMIGQTSTLSWNSSNDADGQIPYTCTDNLGSGTFTTPSGSATVSPTATQTCTLTIDNGAGSTNTCAGTVTVGSIPPPTCTASFSPLTVQTGKTTTLSWTSTDDADSQLPYSCTGNLSNGILSGASGSISFTPDSTQSCTFTADNGAGSTKNCTATISVSECGQISVAPSTIDFGIVAAWGSATQTVSVTNTGSGPLALSSISSPPAPFFIVSGGTCTNGMSLPAAASCTINVKAAPTAGGTFSGSFTITHDSQCTSQTATVQLTAIAIASGGYQSGLFIQYIPYPNTPDAGNVWNSAWADALTGYYAGCSPANGYTIADAWLGAPYQVTNLGGSTITINVRLNGVPYCVGGATYTVGPYYCPAWTTCDAKITLPSNSGCILYSFACQSCGLGTTMIQLNSDAPIAGRYQTTSGPYTCVTGVGL